MVGLEVRLSGVRGYWALTIGALGRLTDLVNNSNCSIFITMFSFDMSVVYQIECHLFADIQVENRRLFREIKEKQEKQEKIRYQENQR